MRQAQATLARWRRQLELIEQNLSDLLGTLARHCIGQPRNRGGVVLSIHEVSYRRHDPIPGWAEEAQLVIEHEIDIAALLHANRLGYNYWPAHRQRLH